MLPLEVASLGTVFVKPASEIPFRTSGMSSTPQAGTRLAQTMATRSDLVTKELGKELGLLQDVSGDSAWCCVCLRRLV